MKALVAKILGLSRVIIHKVPILPDFLEYGQISRTKSEENWSYLNSMSFDFLAETPLF
jgi:hypothetical protein